MINNINSNLFQSFSSGSGNFFADYASIKNGSYAKLMKSYYGKVYGSSTSTAGGKKSSSSNVLDKILEERRNPKVSEEVQKANANLTSGISSLKSSVSVLQDEKTYTDTEKGQTAEEKVVSAMKAYVSQYNDVVSTAKHSTLSGKTSHVASVMRSTSQNADKLAEMGITINSNGTLRINEGKLKATDISKVQELFSNKNVTSYGSTVMSRLQFAGIAAGAKTSSSEKTNNTAGSAAASLKADGELLASDKLFEKIKDKDGKETYDINKIFDTAKSFVSNYNSMLDSAKSSLNSGVSSNLLRIKEKTEQNSDALKQFGISVDRNGRMKIDEETFKKSDMSKVQKLFKDYGASIASSASLVDYYMTTQANAASGYTSAGTYNVQGSVRYEDFM